MKKLILAILLMLVSTSAMAEWTLINSDGELNTYVDLYTIRKNGNKVKMWTLLDYKTARSLSTQSYSSMKMQYEYDCKNETGRILFISAYSGNMGSETAILPHSSVSSADPIIPDSIDQIRWRIACGKQ
ncbi:hypothetical protein MCEKH45_01095 [Methylophilaceae bacterium]